MRLIGGHVNSVEVEGTVIDCLTFMKYAKNTNPMAYEAFAGIHIYNTLLG
jgi:hypothetical protein